jgi:hypothetical protein
MIVGDDGGLGSGGAFGFSSWFGSLDAMFWTRYYIPTEGGVKLAEQALSALVYRNA